MIFKGAISGTLMLLGVTCLAHASEPVTLKFVGFQVGQTATARFSSWWMDEIEHRSNKSITFKRYDANMLCKGPEIVECLRNGRADVGATSPSYNPTYFPISTLGNLPFVSTDTAAIAKGFEKLYEVSADFRAEHDRLGLKPLIYLPADPMVLGTNFAVDSVEDFTSKRIRAAGVGPTAFINALSATPVAITPPEFYESLQTGVIDGLTNSFEGQSSQRMAEVNTHWYDPGYGVYAVVPLWISEKTWAKLSDDQRAVITEVTNEALAGKAKDVANARLEELCTEVLASRGKLQSLEIFSDALKADIKTRIGTSAYDRWVTDAKAAGVTDPEKIYQVYSEAVQAAASDEPTAFQSCVKRFNQN